MFLKRVRRLRPLMVLLVVLALMASACNEDDNDLEVEIGGRAAVVTS